jgi:hypothetical protein
LGILGQLLSFAFYLNELITTFINFVKTFNIFKNRYINSRKEKRYARKKNENLSPEVLVLEAYDIVFFYQHVLHFGMGYQQLNTRFFMYIDMKGK